MASLEDLFCYYTSIYPELTIMLQSKEAVAALSGIPYESILSEKVAKARSKLRLIGLGT